MQVPIRAFVGKPQAHTNRAVGRHTLWVVAPTQLYSLASSTATALGGKTQVNEDGSISAPSYVLGSGTYNNVESALDAVMTTAQTGSPDGVAYDTSAHDKVTFGGSGHTPVTLTIRRRARSRWAVLVRPRRSRSTTSQMGLWRRAATTL
jgi:hypothetical protein